MSSNKEIYTLHSSCRLRFREHMVALATAVISLVLYVRTLAPTVSGEDGGELAAAAYSLGIPHPTGYPLWTILGRIFILRLPAGDVAWRVNFMSAFWAACTVWVIVMLVQCWTHRSIPAVAAGLALACSREFWEQAIIAEVYTLEAFLFALGLLLLALRSQGNALTETTISGNQHQNTRLLYGFAITFGLGLCNHSTTALLAPVFMVYVLMTDVGRWRVRIKTYIIATGITLCCLLLYLYLPLRAQSDPAVNWGNPATLEAWWDILTRTQHQFIITHNPRTWDRLIAQTMALIQIGIWEYTPWVAVMIFVGALRLLRLRLAEGVLTLSLFFVIATGSLVIPNHDTDYKGIWLLTTYWIPLWTLAAIWLGVALAGIEQLSVRYGRLISFVAATVCVLSPFLTHWHHNDRSEYYFSHDFGMNLLRTMEPDAVYFGGGDHTLFPVIYLQVVEKKRPDVLLANPYGYPLPQVYADIPEEIKHTFQRIPTRRDAQTIFQWVVQHETRPVYSAVRHPAPPGTRIVNEGLLYRYLRPHENRRNEDLWEQYHWYTLDTEATRGEWTAELILFEYYHARARYYMDKGDIDSALEYLDIAAGLSREDKGALNNLAATCLLYGVDVKAEQLLHRVLAVAPDHVPALTNLGILSQRRGDHETALAYAQRALRIQPGFLPALRLIKRIQQLEE